MNRSISLIKNGFRKASESYTIHFRKDRIGITAFFVLFSSWANINWRNDFNFGSWIITYKENRCNETILIRINYAARLVRINIFQMISNESHTAFLQLNARYIIY